MSANNAFYCCWQILETINNRFFFLTVCFTLNNLKGASTMLGHHWRSCLVCNCILSLWQAGEGLGVGCGAGESTARPGSAPQEAAEGAELWLLPAQDTGTQVWPILSDRHPVYHLPWCLHVRHPPGAQVRLEGRVCRDLNQLSTWLQQEAVVWFASAERY